MILFILEIKQSYTQTMLCQELSKPGECMWHQLKHTWEEAATRNGDSIWGCMWRDALGEMWRDSTGHTYTEGTDDEIYGMGCTLGRSHSSLKGLWTTEGLRPWQVHTQRTVVHGMILRSTKIPVRSMEEQRKSTRKRRAAERNHYTLLQPPVLPVTSLKQLGEIDCKVWPKEWLLRLGRCKKKCLA